MAKNELGWKGLNSKNWIGKDQIKGMDWNTLHWKGLDWKLLN